MKTKKLPKNIQKWIDALRSGKYEQAEDQLRSDTGFCCLGVACDISGAGEWVSIDEDHYAYKTASEEKSDVLPTEVIKWLGIHSSLGTFRSPVFFGDTPYVDLSELNDDGFSFERIAGVIESKFKDLVV